MTINLCIETLGDNSFAAAQQYLMNNGYEWNEGSYFGDDGLVPREYFTSIYTQGNLIYGWEGDIYSPVPNSADIGDYELLAL